MLSLPSLPSVTFALAYQIPALILGFLLHQLVPYPPVRAIVVLPGTLLHELLHLVVGLMLNGKPVSLSLWPRQVGRGQWVLGSVAFVNLRWYNALFIGLAPLLAFALAMVLAPPSAGWTPRMVDVRHWTIAAPFLAMCLPSATDLRIAMRSWPILSMAVGWLVWLCLQ